jgi:hypothetical protein
MSRLQRVLPVVELEFLNFLVERIVKLKLHFPNFGLNTTKDPL